MSASTASTRLARSVILVAEIPVRMLAGNIIGGQVQTRKVTFAVGCKVLRLARNKEIKEFDESSW